MFLDLGVQPLANKYPKESEFAKEDFFPLQVFFCSSCTNMQLGEIVSRERMFEDYYYLSSVNPGLVRHFEELASKLKDSRFVVDVGSNDGILLKPLKELRVKSLGVDPSVNVSKIANDDGLETVVGFFDKTMAKKIKDEYGQPDVIVASSIFTHVGDPHEFIEALKILLAEDGRCIIEVEYSEDIIKNVAFERFYLDRPFYYSITSLVKLFASHGMVVTEAERITPHGGSLRVTIQHQGKVVDVKEYLTIESLNEFSYDVKTAISQFRQRLQDYHDSNVKVAGYGSPARVSTICNYGQIDKSLIEYIVDDSPLKQHRFTPGTHIPIMPREHLEVNKPEVLVVFAHEYMDDIKKKTNNAYTYITPFL